jgi:signal transduction histidine kinase/CheY-like chemotaxis protein
MDRKEAQDQPGFLTGVIESIEHPFLAIAAEDHSINLANSAAKERLESIQQVLTIGKDGIIKTVIDSKKSVSIPEQELCTAEGQKDQFEIQASPLLDASSSVTHVIVHCFDISKHKQIEKSLIQAERMHAVKQLSAGITHNLNNLLTALLAPVYALEEINDAEDVAELVEVIQASAMEIGELVKRLNSSLRSGATETHPVDVNSIVEAAVLATRPKWLAESQSRGVSIEVVTELSEVEETRGTDWGLEDILVNLILNAIDAMPEGGKITIASEPTASGCQVQVIDTGTGMDEETCGKVFEPLFTTKRELGTGFGLAVVQSTVVGWGGEVSVNSSPGAGTTFTLLLPRAEAQTGGEEPVEAPAKPHRVRVLVVDDDEMICRFLIRALSNDHEVEAIMDSHQAMNELTSGRWDLALIDLSMPGVPGDHIAQRLKEIDPMVINVLVTGWEFPKDDPRLSSFDLKLQKPFRSLKEIRAVIAQGIQLHDERLVEKE